jgi:Zn-dependent protease
MQSGWRIGSLVEIPLFIDPSWPFIVGLITLSDALRFAPRYGSILGLAGGLTLALLLFGSVLLHELGHSLVARSQGIQVNSITLFFFGGVASIERESNSPKGAFQVAIAGPGVSFALFLIFTILTQIFPQGNLVRLLMENLAQINLVLTLFNLIPGLPLDGGQVLKAAVWQITGNRLKGARWATNAGRVLGWVGVSLGLSLVLLTGQVGAVWLALIGGFILRSADRYSQLTTLQEALVQLVAADAMSQDFWDVATSITRRSLNRFLSFSQEITVAETTPLLEVINSLEETQLRYVTVLSQGGNIAGVIDRGDVVFAIARKLNLPITEAQIEAAKLRGNYPQSLPLPAIARTMATA